MNTKTLTDFESLILYLFAIGLSVFFSLCDFRNGKLIIGKEIGRKYSLIHMVVISLPIILLASYRYCVGTDYLRYYTTYNKAAYINISDTVLQYYTNGFNVEGGMPGIQIIGHLAQLFGSVQLFFGAMEALIIIPALFFFFRFEKSIDCPFVLFLFLIENITSGFNVIKQYIACSIVLFSLVFVYERKPIKFFITVLVAMLFHFTAFVAIPIYYLWNKRYEIGTTKKILIVLFSILSIFAVSYFARMIGGRWEDYTTSRGSKNLSFFISLAWMFLFIIFSKELTELTPKNDLLVVMYIVGTIFSAIGFWQIFTKRLSIYFLYPSSLIIGQITDAITNKKTRQIVKTSIVLYEIIMFTYSSMVLKQGGIFPYQLIY